ncbi:hypothetical protein ZOSMA_273G00040 [Zostera marina]|uniref:F-box domain-containing protein n=1 Tax=Zostera marina TaxID=29655 RepID=A0A0K9PE08_ZOSMR|nr:hypothetical protein ZOSMA_273G00040 [Zostera marina]
MASSSLSSDILYDILRRLDGGNLARVGCVCNEFHTISIEEKLWEDVCNTLWPSTCREDVRSLISSIGGYRKFYADCFPLIINRPATAAAAADDDTIHTDTDSESVLPSDFVSIVDVKYRDRTIYSKIVHGIPGSDGFQQGWFYNCPFRFDMLDSDTMLEGELTLSSADGLPLVTSMERERKDGKLWRDLHGNVKLSWIIVDTKIKQAANLASWVPMTGQRHWPTDNDFFLRFGSILPARNILRCHAAECILVMKFSADIITGGVGGGVRLRELSMQLEDIGGARVNGKNSLLVLKQGLSCHRSRNYGEILKSCQMYFKAQMEHKQEKIEQEIQLDRFCILCGFFMFFFFICCFQIWISTNGS